MKVSHLRFNNPYQEIGGGMYHHEKLSWSAQHLHALDIEIKDFIKQHPFTARGEQDGDSRRFRILADKYPLLPSHWPLMVGDVIHNMRSALDQVIWALTMKSPKQPNNQQARTVLFPVCETSGQYWGEMSNKGNGQRARCAGWIGADALAIVDRVQPYHLGDAAPEHPLAILATYSNSDKHRRIAASAALAAPVQFTFEIVASSRQGRITSYTYTARENLLYLDAELGVIEFGEGTTCDPGEILVKPHLEGAITFSEERSKVPLTVTMLEKLNDALFTEIIVPLDEILMQNDLHL